MKRLITSLALTFLLLALLPFGLATGCALEGLLSPLSTEPIPDDPRVKAVVERLEPSVVGIRATDRSGLVEEIGLGTGVIVRADGLVVTNDHVITMGSDSASKEPADRIEVQLQNGDRRRATVVGRSPSQDLAFLDIDGTDLVPATLVTTLDEVKEGDLVLAIGKAPMLARPVTVGEVTAILRNVDSSWLPGLTTIISSSVLLAQGNSGGPLADEQGRVIGINVAETVTQGGPGGSLSIPAPIVVEAMKRVLGD